MLVIKYIIITSIVVFIVDYSGFIGEMKRLLSKLITRGRITTDEYSLKPFDCSLCMTFWSTLLFTLIVGPINLYTLFLCILSAYTAEFVKDLFYITRDIWCRIVRIIYIKLKL